VVSLAFAAILLACPVHPPSLDVELGRRALPALPPDLARQLAKHPRAFLQGASAASQYPAPLHRRGGKEGVEAAILAQCDRLVQAIRSRTSFEAVTAGFGVLAHLVLDYGFPPSGEAETQAFAAFLASRLERIPVVFYSGYEELPFASRDTLWRWLLEEGGRLPPLQRALEEDFARVGGPAAWNSLDDRSTTFGVASVAFNRATSQYATLSAWVWHHAGGLVPRFAGNGQRILVWKGALQPREAPVSRLGIR